MQDHEKAVTAADAALDRAADARLQAISTEPVPETIRDLALQLQAKVDAQRSLAEADGPLPVAVKR